jgi:hypothetical protein
MSDIIESFIVFCLCGLLILIGIAVGGTLLSFVLGLILISILLTVLFHFREAISLILVVSFLIFASMELGWIKL